MASNRFDGHFTSNLLKSHLKILWFWLIDYFRYFSELLSGSHKEYIRNFAAESFAFLMRKVIYETKV